MADIASGDVTYAIKTLRTGADSRKHNRVELSFGDGALTYPAGGIPILKAKCGTPNVIESMAVVDRGVSGYSFSYDQSAEKLVVQRTDQVDDPQEEASAVAIAAQVIEVEVIGW